VIPLQFVIETILTKIISLAGFNVRVSQWRI